MANPKEYCDMGQSLPRLVLLGEQCKVVASSTGTRAEVKAWVSTSDPASECFCPGWPKFGEGERLFLFCSGAGRCDLPGIF